jgi:hypothetical protein
LARAEAREITMRRTALGPMGVRGIWGALGVWAVLAWASASCAPGRIQQATIPDGGESDVGAASDRASSDHAGSDGAAPGDAATGDAGLDAPTPPSCGNSSCEPGEGEDCATCPADCGCSSDQVCTNGACQTGSCGNSICDADEDCFSCAADCTCVAGTAYYVAVDGNDDHDGTSPATAWRTVSHAAEMVEAGDTVHIKAGDYGSEHVVVTSSGTSQSPISFVGYRTIPGDNPRPTTQPGEDLDPGAMPRFNGGDRTGTGIMVSSVSYVWLKNLQLTLYEIGIRVDESDHVGIDNVFASRFGGEGSYSGLGIHLRHCDHSVIRNSVVTDGRAENISMYWAEYNLIENCESHGFEGDGEDHATDYYIVIEDGNYNIVRNSLAQNHHTAVVPSHYGHGIGIRQGHHNQFIGNTSRGFSKCFFASDAENDGTQSPVYANEFVDCTAYDDGLGAACGCSTGFMVRDGAYENTFRNCRAIGDLDAGICFWDSAYAGKGGSRNLFTNFVFEGVRHVFHLEHAYDNVFTNMVVHGADELFASYFTNSGNQLRNSIITGTESCSTSGAGVAISYSDFFDNGFSPPAGEGNLALEPLFADAASGDFHLKSTAGRWNGSAWVTDGVTSPCIDSGDPSSDFSREPQPNGGRIDMGAYGNTSEASHSP